MQHAKRKTFEELRASGEQGFGLYKGSLNHVILDEWPAWEFFRCISDITPVSYVELWENAGGKLLTGGRMVALKNDPIWASVSKFGLPYPPFDAYDVMWIKDVDRTDAESLGLISRGQRVILPARNWAEDRKLLHL
jgi:hypothetical protein